MPPFAVLQEKAAVEHQKEGTRSVSPLGTPYCLSQRTTAAITFCQAWQPHAFRAVEPGFGGARGLKQILLFALRIFFLCNLQVFIGIAAPSAALIFSQV